MREREEAALKPDLDPLERIKRPIGPYGQQSQDFPQHPLKVMQGMYSCSWKPKYLYPGPISPAARDMVLLGRFPSGGELWGSKEFVEPLVEGVEIPSVPVCGKWFRASYTTHKYIDPIVEATLCGTRQSSYRDDYYGYGEYLPHLPSILDRHKKMVGVPAIHTTTDDPEKHQEKKIEFLKKCGWMPVATCERWKEVYGHRFDPETNLPYRLTIWAGEFRLPTPEEAEWPVEFTSYS